MSLAARAGAMLLGLAALLPSLPASAQQVRVLPLEEMKRRMPIFSGNYVPGFESFYSTAAPEAIDRIALRVTYDLEVRLSTASTYASCR